MPIRTEAEPSIPNARLLLSFLSIAAGCCNRKLCYHLCSAANVFFPFQVRRSFSSLLSRLRTNTNNNSSGNSPMVNTLGRSVRVRDRGKGKYLHVMILCLFSQSPASTQSKLTAKEQLHDLDTFETGWGHRTSLATSGSRLRFRDLLFTA